LYYRKPLIAIQFANGCALAISLHGWIVTRQLICFVKNTFDGWNVHDPSSRLVGRDEPVSFFQAIRPIVAFCSANAVFVDAASVERKATIQNSQPVSFGGVTD
jgi:hypothetical protein